MQRKLDKKLLRDIQEQCGSLERALYFLIYKIGSNKRAVRQMQLPTLVSFLKASTQSSCGTPPRVFTTMNSFSSMVPSPVKREVIIILVHIRAIQASRYAPDRSIMWKMKSRYNSCQSSCPLLPLA